MDPTGKLIQISFEASKLDKSDKVKIVISVKESMCIAELTLGICKWGGCPPFGKKFGGDLKILRGT